MDTHELAWAAGFYDGEGSIWHKPVTRKPGVAPRALKSGTSGSVRISIQQCDPDVLYRFQNAVGTGKVLGPYNRKSPNARPFWTYEANKFKEATAVIAHLWKFLSPIKRDQASRAFLRLRNTNSMEANNGY